MHIEYQMEPDTRVLEDWFFKNATLTAQLRLKVILVVVYLARGRRASFPDTYTAHGDGLTNGQEDGLGLARSWKDRDLEDLFLAITKGVVS